MSITEEKQFGVRTFLERREEAAMNQSLGLFVVEYGHHGVPIVYNRKSREVFRRGNNSIYLGFESWARPIFANQWDETKNKIIDGDRYSIRFYPYHNSEKPMDPNLLDSSLIPNGIVDEVVLSNLLGDPIVTYDHRLLKELFTQIRAMLSSDGVLVIRETITPNRPRLYFSSIHQHNDSEALRPPLEGFKIIAKIDIGDSDGSKDWEELEGVYKGEPSDYATPSKDSYYIFLQKI